jgi:prolyl-tRNA synthetase
VINMVVSGEAAYNAKSGELLLLPEGEAKRRRLSGDILAALSEGCGYQTVNCGNDDAIFSLAERFVREWQDAATSFCEERGRNIRLLAWDTDEASRDAKARALMEAVTAALRGKTGGDGLTPSFVEEIREGNSRLFILAKGCGQGAIGSRPGFICPSCGNVKLPDSPLGYTPAQPGAGEPESRAADVETPGANTITELCDQLGVDVTRTIKAMLYIAYDADSNRRAVASFVRGDYNLSMNKLDRWLRGERGLTGLRSADKKELYELIGEVAGYCGPVGMPSDVVIVCDDSVIGAKNTVVGANRPGYHKTGCCHPRDFDPPIADIAQLTEGTPCACGGKYKAACVREMGRIETASLPSKPQEGIKLLSYRDKDGKHDYPSAIIGELSVEKILLAVR